MSILIILFNPVYLKYYQYTINIKMLMSYLVIWGGSKSLKSCMCL